MVLTHCDRAMALCNESRHLQYQDEHVDTVSRHFDLHGALRCDLCIHVLPALSASHSSLCPTINMRLLTSIECEDLFADCSHCSRMELRAIHFWSMHVYISCRIVERLDSLYQKFAIFLHRLKCRTAVVRIEKYLLSSVTVAFGVSVLLMVLFSVSGPVNGWFCWARRAVLSYACQLRLHIALIRSGFISLFNCSCHHLRRHHHCLFIVCGQVAVGHGLLV